MKTVRCMSFLSAFALLASATAAGAQESPFKFEFHGFVTGSLYYQDQDEVFANAQGQGLLLAAPNVANESDALPSSGKLLGGDVRNSRFSFGVTGPAVLGGTPRAYIEMDFFGVNGAGNFGTEQPLPRLRVAFAELKLGNTLVQVGQQNQLVIPQIPASIAHIANPVTYAAGSVGWRTPGVRLVHAIPVGAAKVELAAEVVKNKWADAALAMGATTGAPAQGNPATVSAGEVTGIPMVQARIKADGKAGELGYSAYVVGVYHQVDLAGFGDVNKAGLTGPAAADSTIDGYVGEVGGRLTFAGLTVAANGYVGNATGNMLGAIVQFGDIADWGAWVNVGYNITKEFSIWGLYGTNRPDEDDVREWLGNGGTAATNNVRLTNDVYGGMIRYAKAGYQVGVEGYQYNTTYATGAGTDDDTKGLQIIGSVGYFF